MKRYLAFKGDTYYPGGGWDDFFGAFDSVVEARKAIKATQLTKTQGEYEWWHVVDTETMKEVSDEA